MQPSSFKILQLHSLIPILILIWFGILPLSSKKWGAMCNTFQVTFQQILFFLLIFSAFFSLR
jgi:hypothetical protein